MDTLQALQTWHNYGVLLHRSRALEFLGDEELERAIRIHKKILEAIEDQWLRAAEKEVDE